MIMASSHEATLKKSQYQNWIKSGLGLKYLKEGLEPFVTDVIRKQHEKIVGSLHSCNTCSLGTLLPQHAMKVGRKCSLGRAKCLCIGSKYTIRTHCPTTVCGQIYDKIVTSHFFGDPNFSNTDITKWVTDPWELAKCYINAWGYKDQTSAGDTDCLGLLSIIINDMEFLIFTTTTDTFTKVRQYRNDIMHSSNLEITDDNFKAYIKDMDAILAILDNPTRLRNERYAQEARTKLQELLENDIYISTTDEISVIREAQISLERNNNIQADTLHDIVQSLDQMKEENQDRFDGIDKAQDSLRKAMDDIINNKSIDQQKLASDLQQVKNDLESMNRESKLDRKSMTDRIGKIENSLKEIDSLLEAMKSEKMRKQEDKIYEEQLQYLEKKTALKERLFDIYEMHLSTVPISPILEEMRSHIGEIYVDVVICDHLLKEQVGERPKRDETKFGFKEKTVKSYTDMFVKNGKRFMNMYMLGDAGMGKTTWCMKLVNDWVKCSRDQSIQTETLKGIMWYELIIIVFLRNATQEVKIIDMIKEQLFSEDTELYEIFIEILRKEPDRCLVVADGLDEWIMPNVSKSLTQNQGIPSKAGLNGCPLLVTTRPSKLFDIRLKETQFDRCIKIEGVKDKDKLADKIIKELNRLHNVKVPKQLSDFKESYQGLSPTFSWYVIWTAYQFESKNPVTECMENPLLLIISVCIWFQYGKIEKTFAGNYLDMFKYLFEYATNMKQFNMKKTDQESNISSESHLLSKRLNEKVPVQYIELMLKLAKFAFENLFDNSEINESKLVFAEEQLKTWFTDFELQTAVNCGILSKSFAINQPLTRMTRMSFLHKSFQEFLSAVHIVDQFQKKNEDPLKQYQNYCSDENGLLEMENVLLFVCGLDPRAASKMSLNCQRVKPRHTCSVLSFNDFYHGKISDLLLKCTMQMHRFSKVYPSAEYHIHFETIKLDVTRNDYSDAMDYICYLFRSNITNIKHIEIRGFGRFGLSMPQDTDNIQFVRNFFSCESPLSLEKCSLEDIDLSAFSDRQLNSFGKWFEKLTTLESLKMINVTLPCNFTLYLQNCLHLKYLEFSHIDFDIKIHFKNKESIDVQNCSMNLSPEGASGFGTPLNQLFLLLSGKGSTAGNSSVSHESENQIIAENMFRIGTKNGFSLKINQTVANFCAELKLKQNSMQRKEIEHLVKSMKVQCLVINSSDVHICIHQRTELIPFLTFSELDLLYEDFQYKLNSLRISNASVLETEHLIQHALSSEIMEHVYVSTEIIDQGVLDLVSCRHLEELSIRLSQGQLKLQAIVEILESAQHAKRLLRLTDSRVSFELKAVTQTIHLLRSHNTLKLYCFNTNKQETENVVRLTVKNQNIIECSLFTESMEYDTLLRLIECKHLNNIFLILTNINLNQIEREEVATKLFQNFEVSNHYCAILSGFFEYFFIYNSPIFEHVCRRETCLKREVIISDNPGDIQKLLRILSFNHMHLLLKYKHMPLS